MDLNESQMANLEYETMVNAVAKAVGPDFDDYKSEHMLKTNNNLRYVRGDLINTNLSAAMLSWERKIFRRFGWQGVFWIDRKNRFTYSVMSEQALQRALSEINWENPHYLPSILHVQNRGIHWKPMQPGLFDDVTNSLNATDKDLFGQDIYENVYFDLIGHEFAVGYTHLVVAYTQQKGILTSIRLILFSADFKICREWNLMDMVRPDFLTLTKDDVDERNSTDIHRLVSVKASAKENHVAAEDEISLVSKKEQEGKRQG